MQLEVVDRLVLFLGACKWSRTSRNQLEVSMVIRTHINVISSSPVALLVPVTVRPKCTLLKPHTRNSLEHFTTAILRVKDILAPARTNLHPILSNMHNLRHMGSLRSQLEVPCLVSH